MELKLVYRVLRKISDWTLGGFYSEVYVEGQENITRDGPLIITSSHHNEIIDIATLAATIPYRRHVSFWAKSTMFANPISRAILLSSGSIPVKRNPNNTSNSSNNLTPGSTSSHRATLFRESSTALSEGQVIGVFPEGTSYTEPSIVQMMPGAAWAAVEYARWERESPGEYKGKGKEVKGRLGTRGLVIVPVGIVYTNKSQYRSRVRVTYGRPIAIDSYAEELTENVEDDPDMVSRVVVKKIMAEVEKQMFELTINAPDWDTLYAARIARDLLWGNEENIPLKDFVLVSQTLVKIFSASSDRTLSQSLPRVKQSLIKYYALLHYTGMTHSSLNSIYPIPRVLSSQPASSHSPSILRATLVFLAQLALTLLHPRLIFFLPPLLVHIPAYLSGTLAARYLATRGEEEGQAQFKAIAGGFGMGIGYAGVTWGLVRWLVHMGTGKGAGNLGSWFGQNATDTLKRLGVLLSGGEGRVKKLIGILSMAYGTAWVFAKWHNALVSGNYRQYKRLLASHRILAAVAPPHSADIQSIELEAYTRPPPPPANPFIKRQEGVPATAVVVGGSPGTLSKERAAENKQTPKSVAPHRLVGHLLNARVEAGVALGEFLRDPDLGDEAIEFLKRNRAVVPVVSS